MSRIITITSVTANTPVEIYYSDSSSGPWIFVATVATFPYSFEVFPPYDGGDIYIELIDTQGCEPTKVEEITPSPTPNATATPTTSQTQTPTNTQTSTQTPTVTPTPGLTSSQTPTLTQTPTKTPTITGHSIGGNDCNSTLTATQLYTMSTSTVPVIGLTLYQNYFNGVLYNPYNGGNNFILISWGGTPYLIQISPQGVILSFITCITPTPTNTPTFTVTPTTSPTTTMTPTNTQTQTGTPEITQTPTQTATPTGTKPCVGYTLGTFGMASIEWFGCDGNYYTQTFTSSFGICTDGSGYVVTFGSVTVDSGPNPC